MSTRSQDLVAFGATSLAGRILNHYLLEEFGAQGEVMHCGFSGITVVNLLDVVQDAAAAPAPSGRSPRSSASA
jgi:hypothetical protein